MHPGITNNQSFTHAPSMSLPSVVHPNLVMPPRFSYHHAVMMMPPPATQQQLNSTHHQQQPNPTVGRQVKGKSFNQQQSPQQPSRKVIQVCLGQNVQLHQSENAWKPTTLSGGKKEEMVDADEVAIIVSTFWLSEFIVFYNLTNWLTICRFRISHRKYLHFKWREFFESP